MDAPNTAILVIGGGMIGSSAARHLAESGHRIVVAAAPEPADWSTGQGPFASHYDAARITRVIATDPVWAALAARSMARYADIETRSGITFHDPCGLAWIGHDLEAAVADAAERGASIDFVSPEWLYAETGIRAPDQPGVQAVLEHGPAGVVNPRELPRAQLALAEQAGATVIHAAVDGLRTEDSQVVASGSFGEIRADQVLLATGAYGAELVGVDLGLIRNRRTVLRVDLGPVPGLPALIIDGTTHPDVTGVYWTPPQRYPDGRTLFKIGGALVGLEPAEIADLGPWFAGDGDPREAAGLLATTRSLLPDATLHSWDTAPCVTTDTASGYPAIGFVDDRVAVAVAGNGASAKSCDEIGRLAASLFDEQGWIDPELPEALFTPRPV